MSLPQLLFAAATLILAAGPVRWLLHTWSDPAFDSAGPWVFALVVALFAWSGSSRDGGGVGSSSARVRTLLYSTAAVRFVSHVLDVDVLGACALVIDVYALALLSRLPQRRRALSPGWLAVLFAFCLPLERILQRIAGYGLQWISAKSACSLLGLAVGDLQCAGVAIRIGGRHVLVDVPCSGARGLVALGLLFATACAVRRPKWCRAAVGIVVALAAAGGANVLRILTLAVGFAYPARVGIDAMAAPWHELIGTAALCVGAAPIVFWARGVPVTPAARGPTLPRASPPQPVFAAFFLALALSLFVLPHRPVDASAPVEPVALPATLLGYARQWEPLEEKERIYFTRYGGRAVRARYGPFGVLAVTTTAPLRHLHAPDECLRGSGHSVRLLGTVLDGRLPSAVYRSRAPDGQTYRVAATFVSSRGELATSVGEVAWRWMRAPGAVWTELQRVVPADWPDAGAELDAALAAALELPAPVEPETNTTSTNEKEDRK